MFPAAMSSNARPAVGKRLPVIASTKKMLMIEIRESKDTEIWDALAVHEAAFAKHHSTYHARPADASKQSARLMEGVRAVAVESSRIVGTVQFADHETHIHILGLAVHPSCQNSGIARLLIDWVTERAVNLGYALLVADTIEESGNVPFFERLGFTVTQKTETDQFQSDLHDSLYIVKLEKKFPDA